MTRLPTCSRCGGLSLLDPCRTCAPGLDQERPALPVDAPKGYVGRSHPTTAQAMQAKAFPKAGSLRRQIVDAILETGGLTDYELEDRLGRSHQSASGARRGLVVDGWLREARNERGPITRTNRFGNEATVWEATPALRGRAAA